MKKILIVCVLLIVIACAKNKEVRMTDPNLNMKGFELYYQEELFTGIIIQQIPMRENEIRIKYKNGVPIEQEF